MRFGSRLFLSICLIFSLYSCTGSREVDSALSRTRQCIESDPEYALYILDSIGVDRSGNSRQTAEFALLYSMALDKNYIDVADDSIIDPAVRYFRNHGTAEDKLLTDYYRGIIYLNASDPESAMKCFVSAERHVRRCRNDLAAARLYKTKMLLYQDSYEFRSAIGQADIAAKYFIAAGDTTRYLNTVNDMAVLYSQLDDFTSVSSCLETIRSHWTSLTVRQKSHYYSILLGKKLSESSDGIESLIDEYLSEVQDSSLIIWQSLAHAWSRLGRYDMALDALAVNEVVGRPETEACYWIEAEAYRNLGSHEKALESYRKYVEMNDAREVALFEGDTKYIEERYAARMNSMRQRLYLIILILSLAAASAFLYIIIRKIRTVLSERDREREQYNQMLESLNAEILRLKKIRRDSRIDKDIISHVDRRLNVLNMFVLSNVSRVFQTKAYKELSLLMENREDFMESTRKSFVISHPEFLSYLKSCKLTDWEIGCCCLYCIGFNGNELSDYLRRKAIYNVNSVIRRKLGISKGSTQLDTFLRQKMSEMS